MVAGSPQWQCLHVYANSTTGYDQVALRMLEANNGIVAMFVYVAIYPAGFAF